MPYSPIMVQIDKVKAAQVQRMFKDYPRTIGRIFKESVNKAAGKARTDLVAAGSKLTGIQKKTVRRFTSIKRATATNWTAYVRAFSRKIPVAYLGMDPGPEAIKLVETTRKQAIWLYYNYFRKKYGKKAVFALKYKIRRAVHENITYKIYGHKTAAPAGSFLAKMKSGYVGVFKKKEGAKRSLEEVKGPSIGEILSANKIEVAAIQNKAMKNLQSDVDARIERYLKMRKPA